MDQSTPPTTANPYLSQATATFLAKHKAIQDSLNQDLRAKNAALYAELRSLTGEGPLLNIALDQRATKATANEKAAKRREVVMKDFDAEVGRAEEREEVEKEMSKGAADFGLQQSLLGPFKDAIARYEARER